MARVWDIPVHDPTRVRDVRVAVEAASTHVRLDPHRTAVAALVATELATNLVKHASGGRVLIDLVDRPGVTRTSGVQVTAIDYGPGIHDITAAIRDGYTTSEASLGAGLGTCLRISSDFDLHSTPRGTVAVARVDQEPATRRERRGQGPRAGGINVPLGRDEHSGDAWSFARSGSRCLPVPGTASPGIGTVCSTMPCRQPTAWSPTSCRRSPRCSTSTNDNWKNSGTAAAQRTPKPAYRPAPLSAVLQPPAHHLTNPPAGGEQVTALSTASDVPSGISTSGRHTGRKGRRSP
ncbi:anti-sigma regulatory factor [Streptomyces sp. MMG1121]|uniref:anti-sigma regulatory factor n=1 Tax=Streptomyces sp. MMG1121 TaxID=1415544 RepID=UPI000A851698